jgi:NgoMIV restriction enzyme
MVFRFEPYRLSAGLQEISGGEPQTEVVLQSDHVISPDLVIVREWESNDVVEAAGRRSTVRRRKNELRMRYAGISCKWTFRSDRSKSVRSEALNLIRDSTGKLPYTAVVTAEPLPSRLAALALGTSELDCVYHFALPELVQSVDKLGFEDSGRLLQIMVDGKRLKDIVELPIDLAMLNVREQDSLNSRVHPYQQC